jgi:hypothetical protein
VYLIVKLSTATLETVKYIWYSIKPFFLNASYIVFLFILILIFNFILYLFKNTFDISKPIILSVIQGLLYVLFLIVFIVDVLQIAFKIPLINIIENDIDKQYNKNNPSSKPPLPPKLNDDDSKCININKFKDPESVKSFYDLQINNYNIIKKHFDKISNNTPPLFSSHQFKPKLENPYINGCPQNIYSLTNTPNSQFDNDINNTLKYWMDNSSNIIKQPLFT